MIEQFFSFQGKTEGIKNAPYPRQFSTFNQYFVWLFIFLLPFGMLHELSDKMDNKMVWLTIPLSVIVAWVFHTMERIGQTTVNPFEGGVNDVPITALCRTIEIDLMEMFDETNIPNPILPKNDILM